MLTLSLCQKNCSHLIPSNLGKEIGAGAHGQVFELTDDPNKVIKISIIYSPYFLGNLQEIEKVLKYLINHPDPTAAKIFRYQHLGQYSRSWDQETQEYFLYYYIMEKCFSLTEDEKKIFHSILSHEDQGKIKNYSDRQLNKILSGLARGLDFPREKVKLFLDRLARSKIIHNDLHIRNIMKDKLGNYKLIDFDYSTLKEK